MKVQRHSLLKTIFNHVFFPKPPKPPYKHVCQIGDPVLRSIAAKVPLDDIKSPEVQKVISTMIKVMKKCNANGLAAPQIGIPLRIIIFELPKSDYERLMEHFRTAREVSILPLSVFINPQMKVLNYETVEFHEGCNSVRGYTASVARYRSINLSGFDASANHLCQDFSGWSARIVQHEMDHLQGELYVDKMDVKSFQNPGWYKINAQSGRVKLKYR